MKKLWLLLLLVIPYQSTFTQEVKPGGEYGRGPGVTIITPSLASGALTVEQCRANQKAWLMNLGREFLGWDELDSWHREMVDCENVDSGNQWQYYYTATEIVGEQYLRMTTFLRQHNLWGQFMAQGAQRSR
jgi:hypothetical protein